MTSDLSRQRFLADQMTHFPKPLHEFQPSPEKIERSHIAAEDRAKLRAEDEHAKQVEIPLKAWLMDEAQRCHVSPAAIEIRLRRGKYPELKLRYQNSRVVFVVQPQKKEP